MSKHICYSDEDLKNQIEINNCQELLNEKGCLNVKGWSRQPCLKYNPNNLSRFKKAYRLKEWNYYSIGSNSFYFAVAAIDLGYINNYQCFFIDFSEVDSKPVHDEITSSAAFSKGLMLPKDSCEEGIHAELKTKNFNLQFSVAHQNNGETIKHLIKINNAKMKLVADLEFDLSPNRESVVLITPIGEENFYYNRKTNLIPINGTLRIDGKEMLDDTCFGIMDWGRGIWDYNSFWLWCSAWGKDKKNNTPIGLNFGSGFGNLSTHTENAVNIDGVIHKLGHVDIKYNELNLLEPWTFHCKHGRFGGNPLTFTPIKKKLESNNFLLVMSSFHQILGKFSGELVLDSGEIIQIDDIYGFVEVHKARW
ncbi:hypothetical protein CYY_001909 [Polysphondylium violaceum]|uniref:DUF2804 domain-containing protein n=1 Tax=Polysphondylium violaceum TaxID=133409 RepID=A0A8J4Q274_9MYCE|nr:hypothetical protein CYY_001909 [Polysphondylium violaceum]